MTFRSNVRLVSVPVVVRDRQGRAVGNLTRDDFQLFENGKPQILSRFAVERLEPPAPETASTAVTASAEAQMPGRFVAYVFDDLHMGPEHLLWLRNAVLKYLDESGSPQERAAIYTTSGKVSVDFTGDRSRLRQALLGISPRGGRSDGVGECPPMTEFMADQIVNKNDQQALATAIADYMDCAGPSPGGADKIVQAAARKVLALADADTGMSLDAIGSVIGKLATMPGQRSLVLASPGFLLLDSARRQQQAVVVDRAIRVNVLVNALDARGLDARIPGGDASQRISGNGARIKVEYQRRSDLQLGGVLAELASGTGGRFFENSNDAAGALARISTPEYLYILGFAPQSLKQDGGYRTLKVTLRNPKGLTTEARRGYYAPRGDDSPAEHDKQEIEEALFSREETRNLPVDLQTQFTRGADGEATVGVLAKLHLDEMPFRKEADRNRDDVTLVTAIFDQDGNFVSGMQKILEMRLRDETLERRRTSGYTVRTDFQVGPGRYLVRLVARDSEGRLLTARSSIVEVPQ